MSNLDRRLDQYAELLVRVGLNVQPDQTVMITAEVPDHIDLVRRVTAKAYEAGARKVYVNYTDFVVNRLMLERAPAEALSEVPPYMAQWREELAENNAAFLSIGGSDPNRMGGIEPQRMAALNRASFKVNEKVSRYFNTLQVSWSGAAAASPGWANAVFPHLPEAERVPALWDAVLNACRITGENDPVADWKEHMAALGRRAEYLDGKQFARLHFRAPGTDLTVDLPADHRWLSIAGSANAKGTPFVPNIPSEECFTAPARGGVNGVVRATLPLNYNGNLITGMTLRFEQGKVVEFSADSGADLLQGMLDTDEGARYLGEVALVPVDSPIARTGILFYNTLFDENASCHLALGRAYVPCVAGATAMSGEAQAAAGLNQSLIHVDFMIGSPEMEIDAETTGGERVPLFRKGNWAY